MASIFSFLLGLALSFQTGKLAETAMIMPMSRQHRAEKMGWAMLFALWLLCSGTAILDALNK